MPRSGRVGAVGAVGAGPPGSSAAERVLVRSEGGLLVDALTCRRVSLKELADDIRRGRRFRARDGVSGQDRTYQVLAQVLGVALGTEWVTGGPGVIGGLLAAAVREGPSAGGGPEEGPPG
ncbi:hypothetical protein [Kitasatospora sp. NPDC059327]|uniref:hypothetical protein n=1 Tax=Kitasatospora sp. NPDC059327 TaxID=3346803 RepID=UPI0036A224BF